MFDWLKNRPARIVRVKFTSRVNARGVDDSQAIGREIGTELDIAADDLGVLEGSVTVLGRVSPDGTIAPKPAALRKQVEPAKYDREPVPARWDELPGCFRAAWNHIQDLRELRFKANQAEKELGGSRAVRGSVDEVEGSMTGAAKKFIRARDDVNNFNFERLQRAYVECGNVAVSEIRSVEGTRAELEWIAFEIFSLRTAALELNEGHARRVFAGSALHKNYVFPRVIEQDMRSAGNGHTYMDAPILTIASRVFEARDRREKLTPLLEKAKAERAAAAGATAPKSKLPVAA